MIVVDSHEFIELYRGDKDVRMGIEMLRIDPSLRFVSIAPEVASPNDRERYSKTTLKEIGLPELPPRFELRLLPGKSIRFARKESGGIVSWAPGLFRALREVQPDVIMENPYSWLTPRSYQTYAYAKKYRVPVVYYDPGDDIPVSLKHRIMSLWESPVVRSVAAIITYNEAGKRRFMSKYGYPDARIHVIPKPVDVASLRYQGSVGEIRASYGVQEGDLIVTYIGRLAAYKASAVLLDVARAAARDQSMRKVRFVFVGDAVSSRESRDVYELPNTHVTGMVPHSEVPKHLAASDVIVFPDVTRPGGFPTAVAEAMGAGKPLVVGVGTSTEFMPLKHLVNSWLVPPRDPDAIANAIRCLAADEGLRKHLGLSVGHFAETHMNYPVVAAKYLDILRSVCCG